MPDFQGFPYEGRSVAYIKKNANQVSSWRTPHVNNIFRIIVFHVKPSMKVFLVQEYGLRIHVDVIPIYS